MSYVDAIYDRKHNRIKVVERINGKRVFTDSPVIYEFYYADVNGKYKSVNGDSVSRVRTKNFKEYSELKGRISAFQTEEDILILNKDDEHVLKQGMCSEAKKVFFSLYKNY